MPKHQFLTLPFGREVGLTSVSIGLVRTFERLGVNVGFYKPFSQSHEEDRDDPSGSYLRVSTTLNPPRPIPFTQVSQQMSRGDQGLLINHALEEIEKLDQIHDVLVIEGLVIGNDQAYAEQLNAALGNALNAELILILRPSTPTNSAITQQISTVIHSLPNNLKTVPPAIILNRIHPDSNPINIPNINQGLAEQHIDAELIGVIPEIPELSRPRVSDLFEKLSKAHGEKLQILQPGAYHSRRVTSVHLCARHVHHLLPVLKPGHLIITPADRSDVIIATALAASQGIRLAGLLLTSDCTPEPTLMSFCADAFASDDGLPIALIPLNSFNTIAKLEHLNPEIHPQDRERVNLVMDSIARRLDAQWFRQRCDQVTEKRLTPIAFKYQLAQIARTNPQHILLPEGNEPRTIEAAIACTLRGIAHCTLVGNPSEIASVAAKNGLELPPNLHILDPLEHQNRLVPVLCELRKHKNLSSKIARESLEDPIMLATLMLATGEADGLVSGAVHSTADTVRPALSLIKTAPDAKLVSSIFFMCLNDQVKIYGDCAINPDPTAEQLADIAIQSAASAAHFGFTPIVAMLSFSTHQSARGQQVDKVRQATELVKHRAPDLIIDGPLQYDAATNPEVAANKAPNSPVAGRANVLIFPDLNTGNTTYKAVQRSAGVDSIGPMLQGLNRPVNDLSRGASVEDIIYTITLTVIQAQNSPSP